MMMSIENQKETIFSLTGSASNIYLNIQQHPYKGRCYFSTKRIPAGTVILQSKPWVSINDCESRNTNCAHCLKFLNSNEEMTRFPCTRGCSSHMNSIETSSHSLNTVESHDLDIKSFVYCSEECREEDWLKYHRFECGSLLEKEYHHDEKESSLSMYARDYMRLLARSLIQRAYELSADDEIISNELHDLQTDVSSFPRLNCTFDDVWKMCSNASCFPEDRILEFAIVAKILTLFLLQNILPSFPNLDEHTFLPECPEQDIPIHALPKEFLETNHPPPLSKVPSRSIMFSIPLFKKIISLICKEECNSFGIYTFQKTGWRNDRQPYALAIYPKAVFFNHSCVPNVGHVTRERGKIYFYTLRDIEVGEELMISYVSLDMDMRSAYDHDDIEIQGLKDTQQEEINIENKTEKEDRRELLRKWFFFDCLCDRCVAEDKKDPGLLKTTFQSLKNYKCLNSVCKGWSVPLYLVDKLVQNSKPGHKETLTDSDQKPTIWVCEGCHEVTCV